MGKYQCPMACLNGVLILFRGFNTIDTYAGGSLFGQYILM